jgi:pyruvate,orthophosphate dikinase
MHAAEGILTARGGMTSHAAVVARGMGRPASRAPARWRSTTRRKLSRRRPRVREGDDHHHRRHDRRGDARRGADRAARAGRRFRHADGLGRRKRRLKVRANAETPLDCRTAREFGAEGIGLCRTEHMFFDAERIMNVRR